MQKDAERGSRKAFGRKLCDMQQLRNRKFALYNFNIRQYGYDMRTSSPHQSPKEAGVDGEIYELYRRLRSVMSFLREYIFHDIFFFEMLLSYIPFIRCFKLRRFAWVRVPLCLIACYCFSHFVPLQIGTSTQAGWLAYSTFWYVAVAACLCISLKICCKCTWINAIFFGISVYAVQHIFFRIKFTYEYIYRLYSIRLTWLNYLSYWLAMGLTLLGCYILLTRRYTLEPNFKVENWKVVSVGVVLIIVAVGMSQVVASSTRNYRSISPELFTAVTALSVISCMMILDNMFSNVRNKKTEEDARIIRQLWQKDRKQYELAKQHVESVNARYHDMKYMLRALAVSSPEDSKEAVNSMLSSIEEYSSVLKTGNETLDVVLSEKSMQCGRAGIRLACIADGGLLEKMNPVDIYSLFGNALDNAIESLSRVTDEDKKLINLTLNRVGDMAKLHIENYVEVQPRMSGGIPQTTKSDKLSHGFGLKSMQSIVEKYKGTLHFSVRDHIFSVYGIIPLA